MLMLVIWFGTRKGKTGKPYEFGNKVNVAVSNRGGWFVGAKSFTANPYDGHTMATQMKQVEKLRGRKIKEVRVDMDTVGTITAEMQRSMWTSGERGKSRKLSGEG